MTGVAIRVQNLGKRYQIGRSIETHRYRTLRDSLTHLAHAPLNWIRRNRRSSNGEAHIWALRDVSFEVRHGEVLGIIGRNGAGKSTLLKILSRITEPTEGYAETIGRVGSLLEVGTGFHVELTGRENIFLNGAILGIARADINRKFDEIVDFAGIEPLIDTPVKHYSSGMIVRLAFGVAAHLEPEILLVDEALAVGDAAFQEKCIRKMSDVAHSGRTVLFVSHNLSAVSTLCPRSLYLENGRVVLDGESPTLIEHYLRTIRAHADQPLAARVDRNGTGRLRFTAAELRNADGVPVQTIQCGQAVRFVLNYEARSDARLDNEVEFRIKIEAPQYQRLFYLGSRLGGHSWRCLPTSGQVECLVPELPLAPGKYLFHLVCHRDAEMYDDVAFAGNFSVVWGDFFETGRLPNPQWGRTLVRHRWYLDE